jgi:hypothetical protein
MEWMRLKRSAGWRARFGVRIAVALIAVLGSGSSIAGAADYTGVQPRTPVEQIAAGGEMRNFTLVGQNPLIDSELTVPRGMNGGIAAVRDCVYVGSNIGMQPTLIVDMADMSNPTI